MSENPRNGGDGGDPPERFELNSGEERGRVNYGSTAGENEGTEEVGPTTKVTFPSYFP